MKYFRILLVIASLCTHSWASPPVPYSGKVAIDGVNFFGTANFAFEIRDAQGTVHWRNGAIPNDTISVSVTNGRYVVQLGGQGMNPLPPELFLAHDELYLKVRFDPGDGQGLRALGPDQRITATPFALAADLARLAQGVPPGSITREMLANSVLSDLNNSGGGGGGSSFQVTPGSITLDLLSPATLAAMQVTPSISTQPFARFDWRTNSAVIEATGRGHNLSYQWLKNGQPINGATGPVLEIANASLSDNATYAVRLTNSVGQTTSQPLTLQQAIGTPGPPLVEANSTQVPRHGLVLWMDSKDLDADGHADSLLVGDRVTSWTDKITDKNATQADLNKQPVKSSNGSVSFDGSDNLVISDLNVTANHIFIVVKKHPSSNWRSLLAGSNGTTNMVRFSNSGVIGNTDHYDFARGTGGSVRVSAGPNSLTDNLAFIATLTVGAEGSDNGVYLGLNLGIGSLDGEISEILFYDRFLQNNERDAVERYLADKWSVTLHQESQPLPEQPETGLLGRWTFDEGSGDVVYDVSGNQKHGTMKNMHTTNSWTEGTSGTALEFDGIDDNLTIPDLGDEYRTISMWIKPYNMYEKKILKISPSSGEDLTLDWGNKGNQDPAGSLYVRSTSYSTWLARGNSKYFHNNSWHHLAVRWDVGASHYELFADGINKGKEGNNANQTPLINSGSLECSEYLGKLDDLRIYSRSLSDVEIMSLCADQDGDGLTDIREAELGTNPNLADTDGDGDSDSSELSAETSPTDPTETIMSKSLENGLQVHLAFDETNGTTAYDSSGNHKHATLYGFESNQTSFVQGQIGNAVKFDGVDDYIMLPNALEINYTFSFWIKTTTNLGDANSSNWDGQIGLITSPVNKHAMMLSEGKFKIWSGTDVACRMTSQVYVNNGLWMHLAASRTQAYSGGSKVGNFNMYLNGSLDSSTQKDNTRFSDGAILHIGKTHDGSIYYNGIIDDIRIYDRKLSDLEVQALYNLRL